MIFPEVLETFPRTISMRQSVISSSLQNIKYITLYSRKYSFNFYQNSLAQTQNTNSDIQEYHPTDYDIINLCNQNKFNEAVSYFTHIVKNHKKNLPSLPTINTLLANLIKVKKINQAVELCNQIHDTQIEPDDNLYNSMVHALCHKGFIHNALKMFEGMQARGDDIYLSSYGAMLKGLFRDKRVTDSARIYKNLVKNNKNPNEIIYNTLIDGVCKNGRYVSEGFGVLGLMIKKGNLQTEVTFTSLIDGLCKNGRITEACEVFDNMSREGCLPSKWSYSALINGLCKHERFSEAIELCSNMIDNDMPPDALTYNAIVDGFCKAGRFVEVEKMLEVMRSKGVLPDIWTYNCLVNGLCKKGFLDEAMKLYHQMLGSECVAPDATTYNCIIDGFCKKGRLTEAEKVVADMRKNGVARDVWTYGCLINGLCKKGLLDDALDLYYEMTDKKHMVPNEVTFNLLIEGFCKAHRSEETEKIFAHFKTIVK